MKISDLALIARVSPRMLRHYDEIGLFKPALVLENGYREYSVSQVPLLNRILALKDLGFSLEQLTELLREDFALDRLRELLKLKRAELETRVLEEQQRLERVEARLRSIEMEDNMPEYDVTVKALAAQLVASVRDARLEVRNPDGLRDIGPLYDALYTHLRQHGVQRGVPQINLWHAPEDQQAQNFWEAEVTQGLEKPIPAGEHVRVYELAGAPSAACLEYRGPHHYGPIEEHLLGLHTWIEQHSYNIVGPTRQVYLELPEVAQSSDCRLELQVPVLPS
jgi:DNA-binding transcriptional MerR regulator